MRDPRAYTLIMFLALFLFLNTAVDVWSSHIEAQRIKADQALWKGQMGFNEKTIDSLTRLSEIQHGN